MRFLRKFIKEEKTDEALRVLDVMKKMKLHA